MPKPDAAAIRTLVDESARLVDALRALLLSWTGGVDRGPGVAWADPQAAWEREFGRMDDPETRRRIQATAAWLHGVTPEEIEL